MKIAQKSLFCLGSLFAALIYTSEPALAQNPTLSANPPQLTFSTQTGATPPSQTLTITSSAGATPVTISAFSSNNWLMVSPTSGNTPLNVTVTVNPALSNLTTDNGFLNITGGGSFLSVRVELDVNSPGPSPLSASPNSLSFTFAANSTVPQTKAVALSSSASSVTSFTATAITNDGGNWLTVNPTSGNLPNTIQVTANPTALVGSGPFKAVVAINAPGTTGISVPVLVTIAGTPAIQVMPAVLGFAWQIGTAAPAAQLLSITSSTGVNVSFTASAKTSSCGNWLVISPQSGATPSSITAQVNTSGLTMAEPCAGEIDISAPDASNPSVAIQVSLLVSTNPLLMAPATGPSFTYQIGTSTNLAAQNVLITSSSTALNFTAGAAPTTAGGPDFLTATPATGTTPQNLQLQVKPAVLATLGPGTYSETVTLTSADAGNSPQSFVVTLTVNSNALLTASAGSLTFNYEIGQTAPPNQVFTVFSTGSPQNFEVAVDTSNCSGFLSAESNGGTTGVTFGNQNQVVVSVNVAGLTPQVCGGHITLSVPNSSTPALQIPVTLNVSNKALLNVSTNNINLTEVAGATATTQSVSVTSTDSTVLSFTATAATNPIGLTWLSVAPNTGNTPSNLLVAINPANLGVGTYEGTITVTVSGVPSQVIHVTLVIVASNVSANPPSLTLSQTPGGAAITQNVQISGVPAGTTIGSLVTLFNGSGWLTATTSGNTVMVTADATHLSSGAFSGVVTVIVPGAGNSPLYIPVTFNVAASVTFTLSATTAPFSFQVGGPAPAAQSVQITTSNGVSVPFTATFTPATSSNAPAGSVNARIAAPANLISVSPTSGTTPATFSIALDAAVANTLAAGTYTGNVVVSSTSLPGGDQDIKVTVTITAAAGPGITAIVDAASFLPGPISPGELISIFGANLGPTTGLLFTPDNGHVDTTLDDTMVMINGIAAPLIYTSAGQINAIVPYEIGLSASPVAQANVKVTHGGVVSASMSIAVAATAPGIFSANQSGNGQGAILNENLSANSASNPAPKGSVVSIFATGEGLLTPQPATGSISGPSLPLPAPRAKVSVTIGGQTADIQYAGEAPTLVSGVLQVNAVIPTTISSGSQLVVLTIGDGKNTQQSITVAVQ